MKLIKLLPLAILLVIVVIFWRGMSLHSNKIPSPLINQTAPTFQLPDFWDSKKTISNKDFLGQVTLFNVWASWCTACAEENAKLLQLARNEHVIIYGLNYKDTTANAKAWLNYYGNPFKKIAVDQSGNVAIDWGIYGIPETYVIDKKGIIRYKQIGGINEEVWQKTLRPLLQQLQQEPA